MKTTNLVSVFQDFVQTEGLSESMLLLLVSGGVDSMVLLDVASQSHDRKRLAVLHFDHQTRPEIPDEVKMIEKRCKELNITFCGKILDKCEKNVENFWRKERHKFSTEYAQSMNATRTLTAHHATDLVETMIFRLTKGCGVSGLSPFDLSTKPFWQVTKTDISSYAKSQNLVWMDDSSNNKIDQDRNLIRHKILPELRKITPNLEKVFVNEAKIFGDTDDFIQEHVKLLPSMNDEGYPLSEFLALHPLLQAEYLRNICPKTPSMAEMEDFTRWITNEPEGGSQKDLGGRMFRIERNRLVMY